MRLLVATAVEAEREAVAAGLAGARATVVAVGVGPAAAAACVARLLARAEADQASYDAVLCAGIGGGFSGRVGIGDTVIATRSVAAGLGAESPHGPVTLDELGFGASVAAADPRLSARLRGALPGAVHGDVLTVWTVTGRAESAQALAEAYPAAVAEGMEGFGVAVAAAGAGVAFGEARTISNPIGPRDRSAWRIPEALDALQKIGTAVATLAA